jgi:hypothetical protein
VWALKVVIQGTCFVLPKTTNCTVLPLTQAHVLSRKLLSHHHSAHKRSKTCRGTAQHIEVLASATPLVTQGSGPFGSLMRGRDASLCLYGGAQRKDLRPHGRPEAELIYMKVKTKTIKTGERRGRREVLSLVQQSQSCAPYCSSLPSTYCSYWDIRVPPSKLSQFDT